MLPGLISADGVQARREPLNSVSNTGGRGAPSAMQKLASEKVARKAKTSAAVLISDESECASGALASLGAKGVDLKMPPLRPGAHVSLQWLIDAAPFCPYT